MPLQKNLGENADIDSGNDPEDVVSYEPSKTDGDSNEEKSDAQRIADGELEINSSDEIFVNPNMTKTNPEGDEQEEKDSKETDSESLDSGTDKTEKTKKPEESEKPEKKPVDDSDDKKDSDDKNDEDSKASEKDDDKSKPKPKNPPASAPPKVQKRINKLTAEKYGLEAELKKLREENQKLKETKSEFDHKEAISKIESEKPDPDNYDTTEDYYVALGQWGAKLEIAKNKEIQSN